MVRAAQWILGMAAGAASFAAATAETQDVTAYGPAGEVVDYFNSGAGAMNGPYGGAFPGGSYPVPVPLTHVVDEDETTFLSLPTQSYVVVAFPQVVYDGPGDDLFIEEIGPSGEVAQVLVSTDGGASFVYLGEAFSGQITALDLSVARLDGPVDQVKVIGLDAEGGSPGFDLQFIRARKRFIGS